MRKWLLALILTTLFSSAAQSQSNPLWRTQKVKNYLPHMTWPEVEDLLSRTDMVIIPVPAIEQHGPQLPIGTDYFIGEELAKLDRAKDRRPGRADSTSWNLAVSHGVSWHDYALRGYCAARLFRGCAKSHSPWLPAIYDSDEPRREPECVALHCGPH